MRRNLSMAPRALLGALLVAAATGCGSNASSSLAESSPSTSAASAPRKVLDLTACNDSVPCQVEAGSHTLGPGQVMAGLGLTLPPGWQSPEANTANVVLHPPGHPQQRLILFGGVSAVQSTGSGHGTTVLNQVGKTPDALVQWMTTNPDFTVVDEPARVMIGPDTLAVALTVGVSPRARYGDPGCPANPRCADLFALGGDFYGIGGHEQIRLYLAEDAAYPEAAFIVALEAPNHRALAQLTEVATQVIGSMQPSSS